jgi:sterol carrier protein 2
MKEHNLEDQAIEIMGMALTTDSLKTFTENSLMNLAGYEMSERAAKIAFHQSGLKPSDI